MAFTSPFDQLTGVLAVWLAPVGTTPPAINVEPSGSWKRLGATDGGQTVKHAGSLTKFTDDDHTGKTHVVRPEQDPTVAMTLVGLTLENYGKVVNDAVPVVVTGPPATKKIPLKRPYIPENYAMILRGEVMSPYGALPGMYVIPKGAFDGEPEAAFTKDERTGLEIEFCILEDDDQTDPDMSLGWLIVQTA